MIATALGLALFGWSYAVACTSVYGVGRATWSRLRRPSSPARAIADRGEASLAAPDATGQSAPPATPEATGQSAQPATPEATGQCALPGKPGKAHTTDSIPQRSPLRLLVVRPCAGSEPDLDRALASLASARSSHPVACRFAVAGASDPAALPAAKAASALRDAGIDATIVFTSADAPNHKAAQIEAALAQERDPFDVLVVADSDVDLTAFDFDALLAPMLGAPSVGAVWAPPVETGAVTGGGDRASQALLSASLHAFTILGALDGAGLVGKLFAVRRDAIRATGGFAAMTRVLGEDMELARRLRGAGRSVKVAPVVARSLKTGRSWRASVDRYARWLAVIRAQRRHLLASYPLLFFATPLVLLASALLAPFSPGLSFAAAAVALLSRLLVACAARALAGARFALFTSMTDAVLADTLLTHAFLCSLATRTITWRGRTLTIDRRGVLSEQQAT